MLPISLENRYSHPFAVLPWHPFSRTPSCRLPVNRDAHKQHASVVNYPTCLPLSKLMFLGYVCPSLVAVMASESFYRPTVSWPQTIVRTIPHNPKKWKYTACRPPSPWMGFLPLGPASPQWNFVNAQLPTAPLGARFSGNPCQRAFAPPKSDGEHEMTPAS